MKLKRHSIDPVNMTEVELAYAKGYNAAIRNCKDMIREKKQLKQERKALKSDGLLNGKKTIEIGEENDTKVLMSVKAWMDIQSSVTELERTAIRHGDRVAIVTDKLGEPPTGVTLRKIS